MTFENYLSICAAIFAARLVSERSAWWILFFMFLALLVVSVKNIYQAVV